MRIVRYVERIWFEPKAVDWVVIALLAPLSLLYGTAMLLRRLMCRKHDCGIPIISVGNLVVGGSGKTPAVIAIASRYKDVAVVSRGYGRGSTGLVEVSRNGQVLCNVEQSGDEAMLIAQALPDASVIVSERRRKAIALAKQNGARLIILDDGFNRVDIAKYDILLSPPHTPNPFPFPAGPYREFAFTRWVADAHWREGREFSRSVTIQNPTPRMMLVTAIARPNRLEPYLPKEGVVHRFYLPDHSYFDETELRRLMARYEATSLLVTQKDAVKMQGFKLPLSVMKLQFQIKPSCFDGIKAYLTKVGYERKDRSGKNAS